MKSCNLLLAGAVMLSAAITQQAEGAVIVNIAQSGSNVVMSGSGTVNLSALTFVFNTSITPFLRPSFGEAEIGPNASTPFAIYNSVAGPSAFGLATANSASTSTGNSFGIDGLANDLFLPQGYVSGSLLSGSSTYNSATLSSFGLTTGTYVWTWGSGATADSYTLNVGTASTPEPGSMGLLAVGLLLGGLAKRRLF